MNLKEFYAGEAFDAHRYFGAHIEEEGVLFRTYAPGALGIEVIGEFNDWQGTRMYREGSGGIYSVWIPNAHAGQMYKYKIYKKGPFRITVIRMDSAWRRGREVLL